MVVKAVQPGESLHAGLLYETLGTPEAPPPANADPAPIDSSDFIDFGLPGYSDRASANHDRVKLNDAINAVHVALRGVSSMGQIVDGLSGLTTIALQENACDRKLQLVEKEGGQLFDALKQVASQASPSGLQPLGGDPIRLELDRTLGPVLDVILPDERRSPLGLTEVSLATKDMILSTVAKIENARQRLKDLRSAVTEGMEQLSTITSAHRTMFAPPEMQQQPLSTVDSALAHGWSLQSQVLRLPESADSSHTITSANAAVLLDPHLAQGSQ